MIRASGGSLINGNVAQLACYTFITVAYILNFLLTSFRIAAQAMQSLLFRCLQFLSVRYDKLI